MATNVLFSCNSNAILGCKKNDRSHPASFLGNGREILVQFTRMANRNRQCCRKNFTVYAVTKGSAESSKSEEKMPSWAKPDSDEPPPWAREDGKKENPESGFEVPFFVYLLASAITAIAAVCPFHTSLLFHLTSKRVLPCNVI